ncbi:unnamed protein product [Dicrocoelium dendriticum]|nr:unnamed protein product [Dicrocoelium dendriticum]
MADPSALEEDAREFADVAEKYDHSGQYDAAVFFYSEAAQALLNAEAAGSKSTSLRDTAQRYVKRAEVLKHLLSQNGKESTSARKPSTTLQFGIDRAQFILKDAISEEENGNIQEAIDLYSNAVELLLALRSQNPDEADLSKIKRLANEGLTRAEILKKCQQTHSLPSARETSTGPESSGGYTAEEVKVLKTTSKINGREYPPFLDSIDRRMRFSFPKPFSDSHGYLALSEKQRASFDRWVRPSDYLENPKMIMAVSCFSIRQTVVTDCSFVASMAIAAQYERRFKKRLITNIIFPHNRNGEAVYNPCGIYVVRLHINGVPRKVVIDDFLPMGKNGELLCSYSSNRSELWVSLLEKAYMKVMGGYDFPGSNSGIDLHALTGWIPERIAIRSNSVNFNKDKEFRRLSGRFHRGHCLITVATGEMSEEEAKRTGLVPSHAYALLDMREVDGKRLLMLKNPWSHLRWKGNFSEHDSRNWTPDLQAKLNYDRLSAQSLDNGVFWIDYASLCYFFDVFYVNWNPDLFPHTTCVHDTWLASSGPKKDLYSHANNPQYRLEVRCTVESSIWVLLTRHITDKADFADNKEFIAVVVYKNISTRKVYCPYEVTPFRDSARTNSPHCLIQMLQDPGTDTYHLVVSQFEKNNTIFYTLRVYSTSPFVLTKVVDPYKVEKQITGQWKGISAGGCPNHPDTYDNNPCFQINLKNNEIDNQILIEMRGPKDYAINCELTKISVTNPNAPNKLERKSADSYRRGYVVLEQAGLSGGVYNLVVSTFYPKQEGPFILDIKSLRQFTVTTIR